MTRERLPNRREADTFEFVHVWPNGRSHDFIATVGLYPDGRPGEVFLATGKSGEQFDISLKDSAIALSLALQYGCPLEVLAPTFLRSGDGRPEGPLGTLVGLLVERYGARVAA